MYAYAREELLTALWKKQSELTLTALGCVVFRAPLFVHFNESLSGKSLCVVVCVGPSVRRTLQTHTAPRHFSSFYALQSLQSHVETSVYSHFLLWVLGDKQPL